MRVVNDTTRHSRTGQQNKPDKTRHDTTRHDTTRHNATGQDQTILDKTSQDKPKQDTAQQDRTGQGNTHASDNTAVIIYHWLCSTSCYWSEHGPTLHSTALDRNLLIFRGKIRAQKMNHFLGSYRPSLLYVQSAAAEHLVHLPALKNKICNQNYSHMNQICSPGSGIRNI